MFIVYYCLLHDNYVEIWCDIVISVIYVKDSVFILVDVSSAEILPK